MDMLCQSTGLEGRILVRCGLKCSQQLHLETKIFATATAIGIYDDAGLVGPKCPVLVEARKRFEGLFNNEVRKDEMILAIIHGL